MSILKFNVNVDQITSGLTEEKSKVETQIKEGVKGLASMTHAKTMEYAEQELTSTSKMYRDALSFEEVDENVYVVTLDESALWIEEGRKSGSMVNDLLKNNPKYGKDGDRYKAIPFDYSANTPKSQRTAFSQKMVNMVQQELKKRNLSYKKLETDRHGQPLLGKLHSFTVPDSPMPSPMASTPALQGVNIYQNVDESGQVQRQITTFRIVSDKHQGTGKWVHPGYTARLFMDKALRWAENTWETQMLPEIMRNFE